jgi:hypothetical protein
MDNNLGDNSQNSNLYNNASNQSTNNNNSGSNLPDPIPFSDVNTPPISIISGVTLTETSEFGPQYHKYIFDDNDPTCKRMMDHIGIRYKRVTVDTSLYGPRKVLLHDGSCDKLPSGLHSIGIKKSVTLRDVTSSEWGFSVTMSKMVNGTEKSVLALLPKGSSVALPGQAGSAEIKVPF